MADYIYLLENRLANAQQNALGSIREIAREEGLTVFLVGGAVRDLTSGSPVRDLDVVVQGSALKLRKEIERAGAKIDGEYEAGQALFATFPGGARVEIGSTLSAIYPKPGKPVLKAATILDDLRRRDFTANAMAISLNTGSYGLLMDPLNGVADIENRELRLVSSYGFIEDPIRMVRAVRLMARLGWQMDEKTQARYATGKEENYIAVASAYQRGYETEEIVHEEDPLRVMRGLEAEGWMSILAPNWSSTKANAAELERLRENQTQLQMQGIYPDPAAANFPLLTAKMTADEVAELKASFPRQGFVLDIEALEGLTKEFAGQLSSKAAALPSQTWKLLYSAKPEAVLQVAYSSKSAAIQAKFKSFYTEWPQAKQKVPYSLLQELRIVPDLPGYAEFIDSLVYELMDGKLGTLEEIRAFAEPFSPPAPPPPVHLRRARAAKKETRAGKSRAKKQVVQTSDDGDPNSELTLSSEATAAQSSPVEKPSSLKSGKNSGEVPVPSGDNATSSDAIKDSAKPATPGKTSVINKAAPVPLKKVAVSAVKKAVVPAMTVAPAKASGPAAKAVPVKAASAKKVARATNTPTKKAAAAQKMTKSPASNSVLKKSAGQKASFKAIPGKKTKQVAAKQATHGKAAIKQAATKKPLVKPAAKKVPAKPGVKKIVPAKKAAAKVVAKSAGKKQR